MLLSPKSLWGFLLLSRLMVCVFRPCFHRYLCFLSISIDALFILHLRCARCLSLPRAFWKGFGHHAQEALRRAKFKFPGRQKIIVSRKWGFTKFNRADFTKLRQEKRVVPDGVNAKRTHMLLSNSVYKKCIVYNYEPRHVTNLE